MVVVGVHSAVDRSARASFGVGLGARGGWRLRFANPGCVQLFAVPGISQKNPRAHKNIIGTPPPPPKNPKKPQIPPPKTRNFMDIVFPGRIFPGVHKIGAAASGPRITDTNFTDTRVLLKRWPIGCDTPSPFSEIFPRGEHAKWRCDTPPPQKGYLSDACAIPYENKANGCDTPLCDSISQGYCATWGVSRRRRTAVQIGGVLWRFPLFQA